MSVASCTRAAVIECHQASGDLSQNRAGNPQLFVPADVTILNLAMNRGAINFGVFPARNR